MEKSHGQTESEPDLTVILVNYNTAHFLDRIFAALSAAKGSLHYQLIVVDNASTDDSVEHLRAQCKDLELIENKINVGFGRANNQALSLARGRFILLLNTDAFVATDTLCKTVEFMDAHPACGVLGVKLIGPDGSLQPSCRYFPTPLNVFLASTGIRRFFRGVRMVDDMLCDHASVRECDWVPGCYYLVRREVIATVGLFDPRYFLYFEEVDHCQAVHRAGWKVFYYPFTQVVHVGGESAQTVGPLHPNSRQLSELQIESALLYFRKHHGFIGLLSFLVLTAASDAIIGCKAFILRLDTKGAIAAAQHTRRVMKLLFETDLAQRPTH